MKFNYVTFKNFLSYGNNKTTYNFSDGKITVINGKNGNGKSSVLEAIYFCLTGKPYRNVNKKELINTKNKKDCLVELSFTVREDNYLVKRGINPNIFEIIKNGNPLDESSHVKDFQVVLNNITGINESAIEQIIIISNRFYKPFLELPAAQKRSFIENIFGLHLFSEMNENLKQRLTSLKQNELLINKDIEKIDSNIQLLSETKQEDNVDYEPIILGLEKNNKGIEKEISDLEEKKKVLLGEKQKLESLIVNKNDYIKKRVKCENEIERAEEDVEFYRLHDECPTCKQDIEESVKEKQISECVNGINLWKERKVLVDTKISKIEKVEKKINELRQEILTIDSSISKLQYCIINNNNMILLNKKLSIKQKEIVVDNSNRILGLKKDKESKLSQIVSISNEKKNVSVVQSLISDNGIKRYVFSKYTPMLNKYLDEYLELLDSKYRLIFNEEMEETIVAKGYDKLNYGSFSAGEKQRCDLALLFSFLEIAKMKNNLSCNLLFCDEMFADLDQDGVNGLSNIFGLLKDKGYSINLITHDDKIKDLADISIRAEKKIFSELIEE